MLEFAALNSQQHVQEYFFTSSVFKNDSSLLSTFLILGFCIEFGAHIILFKPQYHRIWGLLLILLHSLILLFISPDFTIQILVIGIFILCSPFSPLADLKSDIHYLTSTIFSRG